MELDLEVARSEQESGLSIEEWMRRRRAAAASAYGRRQEAIRRAPKGQFWTGNLHIYIGRQVSAERHRTRGVAVRRGITTVIPFDLGDGLPDAYRFRFDGDASRWEPALTCGFGTGNVPFARGRLSDEGLDWVELEREYLCLAVRPPESAAPGRAELHIQRRSSGQMAVVEFDLEPR